MFVYSKGLALGAEFLVGIETEFILLKSTDPIEAANDAPWSASCGFPSGSDEGKCLEEIAEALRTGEIDLLMYHFEGAPGQVREFPVMIRELLISIAAGKYEVVTGPLLHLRYARQHHTMAFKMASAHVERTLAGKRTIKEAAVRLTGPLRSHHFEVHTIDGTANPHIALATVLGLGLVEVELKIEVVDGPAGPLNAEERTKRGIFGDFLTNQEMLRELTRPFVRFSVKIS